MQVELVTNIAVYHISGVNEVLKERKNLRFI